jgi:hypothetical protein
LLGLVVGALLNTRKPKRRFAVSSVLLRKGAKSAKTCENSSLFKHLKTRKARKGLLGCLPIAWAKYSKIVSCCARKFFYCEKMLKVRNIAKTFFFFALGCLLGAWAKIAKIVSCFA